MKLNVYTLSTLLCVVILLANCKSNHPRWIVGNWHYLDCQDSSYNEAYINDDSIVFNNEYTTLSRQYSYSIKSDSILFYYNGELTNGVKFSYNGERDELMFLFQGNTIRLKRLDEQFNFYNIPNDEEHFEAFLFRFKLRYQKMKSDSILFKQD